MMPVVFEDIEKKAAAGRYAAVETPVAIKLIGEGGCFESGDTELTIPFCDFPSKIDAYTVVLEMMEDLWFCPEPDNAG